MQKLHQGEYRLVMYHNGNNKFIQVNICHMYILYFIVFSPHNCILHGTNCFKLHYSHLKWKYNKLSSGRKTDKNLKMGKTFLATEKYWVYESTRIIKSVQYVVPLGRTALSCKST